MKGKTKFSVFIYFIGLLLGSGLVNMVFADIPEVQRNALIALYNSTNGDSWNNKNDIWKMEPLHTDGFAMPGTETNWHGVTCDENNTMVVGVDLNNNNLSGTLPAELGDLSNLTYLNLASNQLSGTIPSELGKLSGLKELDLHSNQLTGIPPELADLSNLTHLKLDRNPLRGSIPAGLGNLSNLQELSLSANQFNGPIPPELGHLVNLEQLYLHDNHLPGNIPLQLGNLSNLKNLTLNSNQLTGNIPSDIGNLTNLAPNGSDFRWNALYTGSDELRNFLNTKQQDGNWENTQTIAPKGVTAVVINPSSVQISWTPIVYTHDPGGYRVYYSTTPGEPYDPYQTTVDKEVSRMDVKDLTEGTVYYFVVQTQTGAHANNDNPVESEYSVEVSEIPFDDIIISGTVRTADGRGVPGVTMTFSNQGGTATTDANGHYKQVIDKGWSGTVVPTKAGCTFTPGQLPYSNVQTSYFDQDYTASVIGFEISGRVTTPEGIGIQGVTMNFSDNEKSASTDTDTNGYYNFTVPYGWTGEVIPSKTGFEFDPPQKPYPNITSHQPGQDYIGRAVMPVISGRVIFPGGGGVSGVTLSFSSGGGTTITGGNGDYIHAVSTGWTGTVTPSKRGYRFSPQSLPYADVQEDQLNQDYTAAEISTVIWGRVEIFDEAETGVSTGIGLPEVTLTFSNNGGDAVTDTNGDYSHQVDYEWSGEIIPSKPGYRFQPKSPEFHSVTDELTEQNFEARSILPTISGRVRIFSDEEDIKGLPGVSLKFSDKGGIASTDDDGYYNHAVRKGWSGTVTPSKIGYTFSPTSEKYNMVKEDIPHQYFKATHANPIISGTVTKADGTPVPGVTLTFSNPQGIEEGFYETETNGYYSYTVIYGKYGWSGRVTPSKPGYSFDPPQIPYFEQKNDISGEDYTCIPDVILTLQASREIESTLAVRKYYGKIDLTVQITGNISILKYRISKKADNSHYEAIKDIPATEIQNGRTYTYHDQYLEKEITYTYKVEALDDQEKVIMESNEVSI